MGFTLAELDGAVCAVEVVKGLHLASGEDGEWNIGVVGSFSIAQSTRNQKEPLKTQAQNQVCGSTPSLVVFVFPSPSIYILGNHIFLIDLPLGLFAG